jgi:predicted RNase H-like nuclease
MSQKTAKEFLVNNDPARFYAFFLKATQIDKLIEAVRQAEDLQEQVLTTLEDYAFGFQEFLAKDYAPAKQAHEALAEAREVEGKKRIVQKEQCNRYIQDAKAESQDLAAQKVKADENEKKALAKLEEHKADQKSNQDRLQMFKVIEHTCTPPVRKL